MDQNNIHLGNSRFQAGMTLVELLIALALSGILLSGALKVVEANKSTLVLTESFVKAQESGRFSLEILSRDIRMAGYSGCVNASTKVTSLLKTTDPEYSAEKHGFSNGITVIDSYDPAIHPASFGGVTPILGSDVFITSGAVPTDLLVSKTPAASSTVIQVYGSPVQMEMLAPGDVLLVTDCSSASIFAVSGVDNNGSGKNVKHQQSVTGGPDNTSSGLGVAYASGSTILMMTNATYFIAPSSLGDTNSLYRYSTVENNNAVELIPFIEDLVFSYGVDVNNDHYADRYISADELNNLAYQLAYDSTYATTYDQEIADGASADDAAAAAEQAGNAAGNNAQASSAISDFLVSVRVEIITESEKNVAAARLAGYPDDGKLRKRFTRVVQIRNAGIGND